MLKDEVTVILNTCDSYSDCWYPFFKLWYKFFPDHSVNIILNTESKSFSFDGLNIECYQLFKDKPRPLFGEQMNAYLEKIKTPFVITMLEDFFLNSPVDINRILQCLEWMKKDEKIAEFYFTNSVNSYDFKSKEYPGFSQKNKICPYKVNTMGAIWRKDKLMQYSLPKTTPWEWEVYGSYVAFDSDDKFFAVNKDVSPIMNYKNPVILDKNRDCSQLWGVVRGKWVVDSVDKLFKENDISVDYSKRGILSIEELNARMSNKKTSVPLDEIVGKKVANDIRRFERIKKIKHLLRIPYDCDYIQYRMKCEK